MKFVTASTFRKHLCRCLDEVGEDGETLIIPREGSEEGAVVVLSIGAYNSLIETQHLLSTAANRASLRTSIEELERGDVHEVVLP